jgi:radical SAM protein with 4Fe4S-binding SPASM domain
LICQAGRTDISINNQGKVYPCLAFPWEVGDLRKENLEEILKNSYRLSLFRSLDGSEFKDCVRCADNSLCMRCPGLAYSEKGDLFGISPEHCRQTKEKGLQKAHDESRKIDHVLSNMPDQCSLLSWSTQPSNRSPMFESMIFF